VPNHCLRPFPRRDRLRLTVALAASVIGLFVLGGSGWVYLGQLRAARRAATERVVAQAIDEANLLRGKAKAAPIGDISIWPPALAAAKQARSLVAAGDADEGLRKRVETLVAILESEQADATRLAAELEKDRKFLDRLEAIRNSRVDDVRPKDTDNAYAMAFREFGIDLDKLDPTEAGGLLSQRSDPLALAFFVDDWISVRRDSGPQGDNVKKEEADKHEADWRRLVATARATDPDPWRNTLRTQIGRDDSISARRLASDENAIAVQPARSLLLLAQVLQAHDSDQAGKILERAWRLSPNDFNICSEIAKNRGKSATRFATAAVALRPMSAWAHHSLANALFPEGALLSRISFARDSQEDSKNRIVVEPAILSECLTEWREAIRLQPGRGQFHYTLACALYNIEGSRDQAIAEFREAHRVEPEEFSFTSFLCFALFDQGKHVDALRVLRESFSSNSLVCSIFIDSMLRIRGMTSEAIAEYRELVRINPKSPIAHNAFGYYSLEVGDIDTALTEIREATRLVPNDSHYLDSPGWVNFARGELKEAQTALREAIRLHEGARDDTIQAHLRLVERLLVVEAQLDAILHRNNVPADAEAKLDVADLCRVRRRFAFSARYYRDAFQAKAALADDMASQHRLHAAIAAAQAGSSPNLPKDDIRLSDPERARWRAQSLDWLRGDKNACAKRFAPTSPPPSGTVPATMTYPPEPAALARKTLDILTHHRDLGCVRDKNELAKLPENERKDWQTFWADVAALLKKADSN
jgi:eukaryotic-like serine/threonine-protein kinase